MSSRNARQEQDTAPKDCGGQGAGNDSHCGDCGRAYAGPKPREEALRLDRLEKIVAKWGRMQNALLAVLARKGIASKDDIMAEVYARLGDQNGRRNVERRGAPENSERREV